jgi:hypothetical protein
MLQLLDCSPLREESAKSIGSLISNPEESEEGELFRVTLNTTCLWSHY